MFVNTEMKMNKKKRVKRSHTQLQAGRHCHPPLLLCNTSPVALDHSLPLLRCTSVVIIEGRETLYHLLPLYNNDLWPTETNEAPRFLGMVTGRGRRKFS